jgi:uncharacterized RDD family membrane protein YckC
MFGGRKPVLQMPADGPVTSSGGDLSYGGFWARFAAVIIDNAILTIAAVGLIAVGSLVDEGLATVATAIYFIGALLYWPIMESSARQATFGKQLLGLQVTDAAGARLSFVRALLRNIAKIISAIPLYIGFLLAAFTSRKQALHDIFTNCLVLRSGPSNFMKAAAATVAAVLITAVGAYYYFSTEMEKAMTAAQKSAPATKPKPLLEQVQAPGSAFPAGGKPAPAPASAQPAPAGAPPAPVAAKPAGAPAPQESAPKVVVASTSAPSAKPAAAPASEKPATAQVKPLTAQLAPAPAPAAPAKPKPAVAEPVKASITPAAKPKPAPRPEPVVTAAAPVEEAPRAPRQTPAPKPAAPQIEWTREAPIAAGPTPAYNDIMTAVMYRDRATALQLLDLGWWPDRPDSNGVTPLMAAAMNGDAAMTELLLGRGANPTLRGPGGSTLDYAGRSGNAKVADLLRKAGAR